MGDFFDEKDKTIKTDSKSVFTVDKIPKLVEKLFELIKKYVRDYNDKYYYHKGYINKMETEIKEDINTIKGGGYNKEHYSIPKYNIEGTGVYRPVTTEIDTNTTFLDNPEDRRSIYLAPFKDSDKIISYSLGSMKELDEMEIFGDKSNTRVECGDEGGFLLENNSGVSDITIFGGGKCVFQVTGNNVLVKNIVVEDNTLIAITFNPYQEFQDEGMVIDNVVFDNIKSDNINITMDNSDITVSNLVIRNTTIKNPINILSECKSNCNITFENCTIIYTGTDENLMKGSNITVNMINCVIRTNVKMTGLRGVRIDHSYIHDNCDMKIEYCRDIEITYNNSAKIPSNNSNITISNLLAGGRFVIKGNDCSSNRIKVDDVRNTNNTNSSVIWERNQSGISFIPINVFRDSNNNLITATNALNDGEAVMYNDKAVYDGIGSSLSSLAISYAENGTLQTVYPFATLGMGFMTINEITTTVNRFCTRGSNGISYTGNNTN